ncbi:glutamate--cysteine ligase [Coniosporium apollinis]|uniref:Glutamate--cysteine ligase n=1 Tax=Coniosporium apollinis TaxID=61459 RepID=A0ABQ9NL24_9PEZI|nr:glutamate--cysteine ligase [Coniosporium apollinis]
MGKKYFHIFKIIPRQILMVRPGFRVTTSNTLARATLPLKCVRALSITTQSEGRNADYTSEFGRYMVEAMPGKPYNGRLEALLAVEDNMVQRRKFIKQQLDMNEYPFTISMFPRIGAPTPNPEGSLPDSLSAGSELLSSESRYQAADVNINARRGRKIGIKIPVFQDTNTTQNLRNIDLEGMMYGPGHCGLQVTFQASDVHEARFLHDQLIPLGPIMLALTAATPMYGGFLADTDVRWDQISQAVDDRRTDEDSIPRRWSANPMYIAEDDRLRPEYQLDTLPIHEPSRKRLEQGGLDKLMARHFAHIFVHEPLILSESEARGSSPVTSCSNFESLNGTFWPHVRFKLPPADNEKIGWRVEFRAMETQLTDFEEAAFAVFMTLLRLAITHYRLNLYVPIAKVQENMQRAHPRDAVLWQKFFFRRDPFGTASANQNVAEEMSMMTVDEIINGNSASGHTGFPGLLPIIERYMDEKNTDSAIRSGIARYLNLIRGRASGELCTAAHWMRQFVRAHKDYKQDSYVSESICYDMMCEVRRMVEGARDDCRMFIRGQGTAGKL